MAEVEQVKLETLIECKIVRQDDIGMRAGQRQAIRLLDCPDCIGFGNRANRINRL